VCVNEMHHLAQCVFDMLADWELMLVFQYGVMCSRDLVLVTINVVRARRKRRNVICVDQQEYHYSRLVC